MKEMKRNLTSLKRIFSLMFGASFRRSVVCLVYGTGDYSGTVCENASEVWDASMI